MVTNARLTPTAAAHRPRAIAGPVLAAAVVAAALAAFGGGLLRAGVAWPGAASAAWGAAAAFHGALAIGGVMGTLVGVERAVALKQAAGWFGPVASTASVPAFLLAQGALGALLLLAASAAFVAVNLVLVRRQPAAHTALLAAAACAWLAGNLLLAAGAALPAVLPWWFAFLVVTIAAERLEMTRLMRRRPGAQLRLHAVLGLLAGGAALTLVRPAAGGLLYGAALLLLAAWLLRNDIARRTLHAGGLPRYMAACLLAGYGWLAVGGIAWMAAAAGLPARDAALHAVGLGFIGSMVMGHAPVILPAVARWKLRFSGAFYLPLAALHLSLLVRLGAGAFDPGWRAGGALLNVLALVLFAAVIVAAAHAWRRDHAS